MLIVILQILLFWAVSFGFYYLALRNLTFFAFNRFWVLVQVLLGLAWPFLLKVAVSSPPDGMISKVLPMVEVTGQAVARADQEWRAATGSGWFWPILVIYIAISIFFILRTLNGVRQLYIWKKTGKTTELNGFQIITSAQIHAPCTFYRYIFVPANHSFTEVQMQQMIRHETVHIRQWHTADILLCEILIWLFWWNPFIYLWKKELSDLHEFLADHEVVQEYAPQQYGRLLLQQVLWNKQYAPVHTFFQSPIKKRIQMMTKRPSLSANLMRYLIFLPFILGLHTLCAQKPTVVKDEPAKPRFEVNHDTIITIDPVTLKDMDVKVVEHIVFNDVDELPIFGQCAGDTDASACSQQNLMKYLGENLKYPEEARDAKTEGRVYAQFIISATGQVYDVKIAKGLSIACDAEVMRVVHAMPNWTPAQVDGKKVNVKYTLPVMFKM